MPVVLKHYIKYKYNKQKYIALWQSYRIADVLSKLNYAEIASITHDDGSLGAGVGFLTIYLHLSVCFSVWHLKNDASRITHFNIEMFHEESWKSIYFGVKKSKVKVTSHRNIVSVGLCILVRAGCFLLSALLLALNYCILCV